jgi:hypothetical protein
MAGGPVNPPDKIVVVSIDALGDEEASALLSKYCPLGFQVVGFADGRVILSNYGSTYKEHK